MVRLSSLALASATLLAGIASAVKCTQGTVYCGKRLLAEDPSNQAAAEAALTTAGQPKDATHLNDSVFLCSPQGVGLAPVIFVTYCGVGQCAPGSGLNGQDACAPTSTTLLPRRM